MTINTLFDPGLPDWSLLQYRTCRTSVEPLNEPLMPCEGVSYSPRITEAHSGMALPHGLDCYDFACTIRPLPPSSALARGRPRTNYHTY